MLDIYIHIYIYIYVYIYTHMLTRIPFMSWSKFVLATT